MSPTGGLTGEKGDQTGRREWKRRKGCRNRRCREKKVEEERREGRTKKKDMGWIEGKIFAALVAEFLRQGFFQVCLFPETRTSCFP